MSCKAERKKEKGMERGKTFKVQKKVTREKEIHIQTQKMEQKHKIGCIIEETFSLFFNNARALSDECCYIFV